MRLRVDGNNEFERYYIPGLMVVCIGLVGGGGFGGVLIHPVMKLFSGTEGELDTRTHKRNWRSRNAPVGSMCVTVPRNPTVSSYVIRARAHALGARLARLARRWYRHSSAPLVPYVHIMVPVIV